MEAIDFKTLQEFIAQYKNKKVLLTFHSIADTDSVSSAFALSKYFSNARIAQPDYITANCRRIMEKLGFRESSISKEFDQSSELVILLDVNNFEDCGVFRDELKKFKRTILIIDHHTESKVDKPNVVIFNDESYNSTASIVYELIKGRANLDKKNACLLATGIISDSAEFRNAFPKTFMQVGELLEIGKTDYISLLQEIQHPAAAETREGFIQDLFSSDVKVINGMLMVYGKANVHANMLADDAIRIGADVSIFYTESRKEISFSARLRPPLDKTYKMHLGKVMKDLAPIIKGQGGGHPCAAGAYGPALQNKSKFLARFIEVINRTAKDTS
jgi:nanoRNase/pAp phosphatase (c-di-AMP/oligoRNAs hydrolase)